MTPLRILVVDDEVSMRNILNRMLQSDGHTVGFASDGMEALRSFEAGHWNLVITDYLMPEMDGESLSQEIKTRSPSTPVILMTGLVRNVTCPTADTILRKPFTLASLTAALQAVMAPVSGAAGES